MSRMPLVLFALLSLLGTMLVSCVVIDTDELQNVDETLVYGSDNRIDAYQATTDAQGQVLQAEVMLASRSVLTANSNGYAIASTPTFNSYITSRYRYPLCSSEPYRSQPAIGFCSGFMVGPDLIATAGHCVTKSSECASTAFVFGFQMQDFDTPDLQVSADDVYYCSAIVARVQTTTNDWAILRTNREIAGHRPVPIRRSGTIQADWGSLVKELAVVGHPTGLPVKVADGAQLRESDNSAYFQSNLDTYGGNSGSAVFSLTSHLGGLVFVEGILVRGNTDFVRVVENNRYCIRSNVCADTGCPGNGWEEVTRSTQFVQYVPECGNGLCISGESCANCPYDCGSCDPFCGDNNCNGEEDCEFCPEDCGACPPVCGNDACEGTETCSSCAADCGTCPPTCGDGACNGTETCGSCAADCGACPPVCSDGACNGTETCSSCAADCGTCPPICAPKNAFCDDNADCCSNNCKLRTHTCR